MMNLVRIIRVLLFGLLLASVEVHARLLPERSHIFMAETNYGSSSQKMPSSSTLESSPVEVLLMIIKKNPVLQTVTSSSFPCATDSFYWKKFDEALSPPNKKKLYPPPKIAPPEHSGHDQFGGNHQAPLPYESPPNPFLSSS